MDEEMKTKFLKEAIEGKKADAFGKFLAEKFWLQREVEVPKEKDYARTQAEAANREKVVAEAWVEFLIKELNDLS